MKRSPMAFACALLLPSIVFLAHPARADDAPIPLDEAEFLARFERAEPRLAVLDSRIDVAGADVAAAYARENPSIAYDREEVFSAGEGLPENILRLEVPIDLSGRRSRRIRAAELGVAAAKADRELDAFALRIDALEAYYAAVNTRLRAETLRGGRDGLAAMVEVVRARRAAGDASGYDLGRLELELDAYDDAIRDADVELAIARRRIAALVGEPDGSFEVTGSLAVAATPPTATAPDAVRTRGDLRAANLRAESAAAELAAAERGWVPGLVLTAGAKTVDLGDDTATGYVAGISIEIPLFDRDQGGRARARARRKGAIAEATAIERAATTAIAIASDELIRRLDQGQRYDEGPVAKLPDLVRRAETAYREGERPITELLDAHRVAREVRLRQLEIRYEAKQAELALQRAAGHP